MSKSHDKRRTSNYSTVYIGVALYSSPHTVHACTENDVKQSCKLTVHTAFSTYYVSAYTVVENSTTTIKLYVTDYYRRA